MTTQDHPPAHTSHANGPQSNGAQSNGRAATRNGGPSPAAKKNPPRQQQIPSQSSSAQQQSHNGARNPSQNNSQPPKENIDDFPIPAFANPALVARISNASGKEKEELIAEMWAQSEVLGKSPEAKEEFVTVTGRRSKKPSGAPAQNAHSSKHAAPSSSSSSSGQAPQNQSSSQPRRDERRNGPRPERKPAAIPSVSNPLPSAAAIQVTAAVPPRKEAPVIVPPTSAPSSSNGAEQQHLHTEGPVPAADASKTKVNAWSAGSEPLARRLAADGDQKKKDLEAKQAAEKARQLAAAKPPSSSSPVVPVPLDRSKPAPSSQSSVVAAAPQQSRGQGSGRGAASAKDAGNKPESVVAESKPAAQKAHKPSSISNSVILPEGFGSAGQFAFGNFSADSEGVRRTKDTTTSSSSASAPAASAAPSSSSSSSTNAAKPAPFISAWAKQEDAGAAVKPGFQLSGLISSQTSQASTQQQQQQPSANPPPSAVSAADLEARMIAETVKPKEVAAPTSAAPADAYVSQAAPVPSSSSLASHEPMPSQPSVAQPMTSAAGQPMMMMNNRMQQQQQQQQQQHQQNVPVLKKVRVNGAI